MPDDRRRLSGTQRATAGRPYGTRLCGDRPIFDGMSASRELQRHLLRQPTKRTVVKEKTLASLQGFSPITRPGAIF